MIGTYNDGPAITLSRRAVPLSYKVVVRGDRLPYELLDMVRESVLDAVAASRVWSAVTQGSAYDVWSHEPWSTRGATVSTCVPSAYARCASPGEVATAFLASLHAQLGGRVGAPSAPHEYT